MTIVMGLDQHRAQITAEWMDTETGEITRSRIAPAHRQGVRQFRERFVGQELEVALEATTGWRFVADELAQVGAVVHLAEPAETAARRGNKKRAKSDRADARHIRELLTIGRLPESWIPPDHLLDLRAQVRLRHTLSHQRGEWQQRIQAVLYHHGCPQRGELLTLNGRTWLAAQPLSGAAREQITVALAVIDVLDIQLAPLDARLRAFACHQGAYAAENTATGSTAQSTPSWVPIAITSPAPTTIPTAVPASALRIDLPVPSAFDRSTDSVPSTTQKPCWTPVRWAM
jgi:transposase